MSPDSPVSHMKESRCPTTDYTRPSLRLIDIEERSIYLDLEKVFKCDQICFQSKLKITIYFIANKE